MLQSLDTLGAGFQLASHDLDLRGAGNLLGEEQSGHIKEVGYELYQQMVREAVERIKSGEDAPAEDIWSPTIQLGAPVTIPETYIADLPTRLALYRRLSALEDEAEIDAMGAEIVDRFGPPPPEVGLLMKLVLIKALCRRANVEKLDAGAEGPDARLPRQLLRQPDRPREMGVGAGVARRVRPGHADRGRGRLRKACEDRLTGTLSDDAGDREDCGEEGVAGRRNNGARRRKIACLRRIEAKGEGMPVREGGASSRPEPAIQTCSTVHGHAAGNVAAAIPSPPSASKRHIAIGGGERLRQQRLEARVVVQMVGKAVALDADAGFPTRAAFVRLISPFEQVKQEDGSRLISSRFSVRPMLSISSAMFSMSACASLPARNKSACWRLQAKKSRS